MKKLIFLVSLIFAFVAASAQTDRSTVLSKNTYDANYTYYSFPVTDAVDYIDGYTHTTGLTYTLDINKDQPVEVYWYLDMDTVKWSSGTDSINVDIKMNYKHFADQAYTTLKTIAYDADGNGDYGAMVSDSSYLAPTNFTAGGDNVPLTRPNFAKRFQLSITPTSGAGVGKLHDRIVIKKVYARVILR